MKTADEQQDERGLVIAFSGDRGPGGHCRGRGSGGGHQPI
jgi:hypothetical protein